MSSHLYGTDGSVREVVPCGSFWSLEELQELVGGYIEVVRTTGSRFMVINDEGRLLDLPPNMNATLMYRGGANHYIAGPAVVVDTKEELDGPDEDEHTPLDLGLRLKL